MQWKERKEGEREVADPSPASGRDSEAGAWTEPAREGQVAPSSGDPSKGRVRCVFGASEGAGRGLCG